MNFKNVVSIIDKHQASNNLQFKQITVITKQQTNNNPLDKITKNYIGSCQIKTDQKIISLINLQIQEKLQIKLIFKPKLCIGDQLIQFKQIKNVFGQGTSPIVHKKGQVLVMTIWAVWCGKCFKSMNNNQQLLNKNKVKWNNKVRFIGVNADQDLQNVKQKIQSNGWKDIKHVTLQGWDKQSSIIKYFGAALIPYYIIVDLNGLISYVGAIVDLQLQQKINQLLTQQKKLIQSSPSPISSVSLDTLQLVQKLLQQNNFQKQFGKADVFCVVAQIQKHYYYGNIKNKLKITFQVNDYQIQYIYRFKQLIGINNNQGIIFIQKIIQFQNIPNGNSCLNCGKQFANCFYYWCRWSTNPGDFRCRQCIQKKNQNGQYNFLQNSILTNGNSIRVPKIRLGQNLQPQNPSYGSPSSYQCNCCHKSPYQKIGRYLCLGCRPQPNHKSDGYVDLCQRCIDKYIQGDQNIISQLQSQNHQPDHPFLRILFNVKGYYKF